MIHTNRRYAAPVLAAALLALGAADAAAQGAIVRLPERDRPLAGTPAQVFAVGRAEGAEHEMFGEIAGVAFDASDNLYVLDRQAKRVMVYDRTGRFLRQIGKEGQGPGELMVPLQLAMGSDGTVIVSDLGRRGYTLFRPDGTYVRDVQLREWLPALRSPVFWHPGGGIVGTFINPAVRENVLPILFQPLDGGSPSRVYNVPQVNPFSSSSSAPNRQEIRISAPPVFTPPVLLAVLDGGLMALSFTAGYTVRIINQNGQTIRYLQRPMRPRLATQADRERARSSIREEMQSGRGQVRVQIGGGRPAGPPPPAARQAIEERLRDLRFADTIPALQGLRATASGKLWIERTPAEIGASGPIDVVTPGGDYVGTITGTRLPDAFSRTGLAAFIERDGDGVERVVVRRLPPAWR